ncbi:MAG: PIN domain-containing protein [Coriobacteriales bacterium]|nr:PIN domain-containing protein [Coriobacteriales bacterium]
MSLTLLLDTNVWVDNYCADHANNAVVRDFLSRAYEQGHTLVYPAGSVKVVFYVLGHEFRRMAVEANGVLGETEALAVREAVWGCINNMCELATAVGVDEADVWLARKQRKLTGDLEDNLVLAAARRARADYLVTSDRTLIQHATVAALTPQDMLAVL